MNIKEKTIDERINDLTVQFQLLLAKEIERNKELDKEREQREKERIERLEREAKELAEREKERIERLEREAKELAEREKERIERLEREAKELAEREEREAKYAREQVERDARWEAKLEKARIEREERDAKLDASLKKSFKKLNTIISDYGLSSGKEAEFSFKLAIKRKKLTCGGIHFDSIRTNVKTSRREYDLILENGKYVALIEVKRKASLRDVGRLVNEQSDSFKNDFPEYTDKILVCFLAAYVAPDNVVEEANSLGVGVLLQDGFEIKEFIPTLTDFRYGLPKQEG